MEVISETKGETKMNSLARKLIGVIAVLALIIVGGVAYLVATGATLAPRTAQAEPALYSQDAVTSIFDSASPGGGRDTCDPAGKRLFWSPGGAGLRLPCGHKW